MPKSARDVVWRTRSPVSRQALSCLALLLVLGIAQDDACLADDLLAAAKHRQAVMDRLGDDAKAIKLYLGGQADHAAAISASQDIQATAAILPTLFPKGTDSDALPGKSAAKPDIWDNPDDFQQLEGALTDESKALGQAITRGDNDAGNAALRSLAKNACGACHETYRGRKDGG